MRSVSTAASISLLAGLLVLLSTACSDQLPSGPPERPALGPGQLDVSTVAVPANDDFDNAVTIGALPFTDTISIDEATASEDDPGQSDNGPQCIFEGIVGGTAWYRFTPAQDVRLNVSTAHSGFDTDIFIYTGSRGSLTFVACSDGLPGAITFDAVAGTIYHFMVGRANEFDQGGPLIFELDRALAVSLTIDPVATVARSGVASVSGTVECSRPAFVELGGVAQRNGGQSAFLQGAFFNCSGVTPWQSELAVEVGKLLPGKLEVSAYAQFITDAEEVSGAAGPTTVQLIPAAAERGFTRHH
jgi:hypothetical protein